MKKKYIFITIIIIIFDQITKFYMVNTVENIVVMKEFLQFKVVKNTGMAWGINNENLLGIIITDIIVIFVLLKFCIRQKDNMSKLDTIAITCIISGGISNLIDRILKGGVVDFIDISSVIYNFPIFNIADIFIVFGFFLFIICTWNNMNELRKI